MDENTKNIIQDHIDNNEVCLFMKGTPDAPQCGFSMAVSNMLKILEVNKKDLKKVADLLKKNAVHFDELGIINENELYIDDKTKVTIDELTSSNTKWLSNFMSN